MFPTSNTAYDMAKAAYDAPASQSQPADGVWGTAKAVADNAINYAQNNPASWVLGASDTAAQQQAAAEAAKAAEDERTRQTLKSNISGIINGMSGIYDQLYGAINSGVGEAGTRLQDRYAKETGALGEQFASELPKIGNSYASRGLYDSSYRVQGEADATKGYQDQIKGLGDQLNLDKEAIGAQALKEKAKYQADQGGVNALLARLNEVTDLGELRQIRNEIEAKQRSLEGDKAVYSNADTQRATYEAIANTADRTGALKTTLTNIINSAAPKQLKINTAQTIIGSSGLSEEEKAKLTQQVIAAV